jgi:hypothetical protein
MNNHHIQIAELALEFFQAFWSKMQANPDKFQVLAVGKKTFAKNPSIQIQNNILFRKNRKDTNWSEIRYY